MSWTSPARDPSSLLALLLWIALTGCRGSVPDRPRSQPILHLRESYESAPEFGGEVYVLEAGAPSAPPLVLIHGLGEQGARDFEPLLPELSRHYHVLSFDLPGFGRSTRAHQTYSPQRYARFVHGLITRYFSGPVAVLGHSMGGAIAIQLAGTYPRSVKQLALLDVAGILYYQEYLRTIVRAERADDGRLANAWKATRKVLFEIGWWPISNAKLGQVGIDRGRRRNPGRTAALLLVQHDFGPALRRVRAPSFIGWGRHDTIAPLRTAEALRYELAPRAFHVFERSEHHPMQSEPEELLRALRAFLDAPEPDVTDSPKPLLSGRIGTCHRERDVVFEGDYERIDVHRCKRVTLRNVRTRGLRIQRSDVELIHVDVLESDVAVVISRSRVRWTGGYIAAATCLDTDHSQLNLLAVTCSSSRESILVRVPSKFVASASALLRDDLEVPLHGSYQLFRNVTGSAGELSLAETLRARNRRPQAAQPKPPREAVSDRELAHLSLSGADLRETNLQGADLAFAKLTRADLRGADLSRADLRGADLRGAELEDARLLDADLRGADLRGADLDGALLLGARYDGTTKLPEGFAPHTRGMQEPPAAELAAPLGETPMPE
jgi:pimeloyl-ACP methyl ester carboxylesterase